jgi:hypothetical protein
VSSGKIFHKKLPVAELSKKKVTPQMLFYGENLSFMFKTQAFKGFLRILGKYQILRGG